MHVYPADIDKSTVSSDKATTDQTELHKKTPQDKSRSQSDRSTIRSRFACLPRRHLFDHIQADRMVPYLNLGVRDSKLACDQAGFFSPITREESEQICIFCCGILLCSCNVDPAKSSFLAVSEFVNQKWQLGTKQERLITFRDADNDECIFNETNFKDSLTCTSEENIWFTVHLPWANRNKHRPWKPSEPT